LKQIGSNRCIQYTPEVNTILLLNITITNTASNCIQIT